MKVGVFGGTFDPVHWGHLVLAEEALSAAHLDRILFVPSGHPPHKRNRRVAPWSDRFEMIRLAVADVPEFGVSDIEADESRPHYSRDTLARIAAERPGDEIHFLLGSDSLLEMETWRDPLEIVRLCPLVVLERPGFDASRANPGLTRRMTLVTGVSVAISSTMIRERLAAGGPTRFLLPPAVGDYARGRGLYRAGA